MNKVELIKRLQAMSDKTGDDSARMAFAAAATLAEQLPDPPAMAWQDEPTCEGWYWVRSTSARMRACRIVMSIKQGWLYDGAGGMRPLNGRRVCPIPPPPPLPGRKEGE